MSQALPPSSPKSPSAPASRLKKWLLRAVAVCTLLGLLLFGALLWPGWPLHFIARGPLTTEARALGCEAALPDLWLRLHTDGTLRLTASGLTLGDATEPQAVQLRALELRWRLSELFARRALPDTLTLDALELRPTLDASGRPRLAGQPRPAPASTTPSPAPATPLPALPAWLLPTPDRSFTATVRTVKLTAPPSAPFPDAEAGPVRLEFATRTDGTLVVSGQLPLRASDLSLGLEFDAAGTLTPSPLGRAGLTATLAQTGAHPPATVRVELTQSAAATPLKAHVTVAQLQPGDWLRFAPDPARLPALQGGLDLTLDASLDLAALRLLTLQGELRTDAWQLTPPASAGLPALPLSPVTLNWQLSDHGREGKIAPFSLAAGPLHVSSPGLAWQTDARGHPSGAGELRLDALAVSDLLPWLPADLLPAEQARWRELASQIRLDPTVIRLGGGGGEPATPGGLPRLRAECSGGVHLQKGHLAFIATAEHEPSTGILDLALRVPEFNQARWQLAALQDLGIPDLDTPLSVEGSVRVHLPARTVEQARWKVAAGPGFVVPHGPARRWLAHPLPLSSFTLSGHLEDQLRRLTLDRLEFASGRLRFSAGRTQLEAAAPLTAADATSRMRMEFSLEEAHAVDFLPLLSAPLQEALAPVRADLDLLGIETLRASAEVAFEHLPWVDPRPVALSAGQQAVLRVGPERIPLEVRWLHDAATGRITAESGVTGLRLDRLPLPSLRQAAISPDVLDLPVSLSLALSALPFATSTAGFAPAARVEVQAGPGRIRANPFLAADLPVSTFSVAATAHLLPLRFEQIRLHADFAGPTVELTDTLVQPDRLGPSRLQLELRSFPLDWLAARVPAEHWPHPVLATARKSGELRHVRLQASWQPAATTPAPDAPAALVWRPDALSLDCLLTQPKLEARDLPPFAAEEIALTADLSALTLKIRDASTDGVRLPRLEVHLASPLATPSQLRLSGLSEVTLARLPALLQTAGRWVNLPPLPDLNGLSGASRLDFTARSPWPTAADGSDVQADLDAQLTAFTLPTALRPATPVLGPTDARVKLQLAQLTARGEAELKPSSLSAPPWFEGAPVIRSTFTASASALDATSSIDLRAVHLAAPPLRWGKPAQRPATLRAKTRWTAAHLEQPARVVAEFETDDLPTAPLILRATAELADARHPGLSLLPDVHTVRVSELRAGASVARLDLATAADGVAELDIAADVLDLTAWFPFLPLSAPTPAVLPKTAPSKIISAPTTPLVLIPQTGELLPALDLPDLRLRTTVASLRLGSQTHLPDTRLSASLRAGRPERLALQLRTGGAGALKLDLAPPPSPADSRQPWTLTLTEVGDWVHALGMPLDALPPAWAETVAPVRELHETFLGGTLDLAGTVDWKTRNAPVQGKLALRDLRLQKEILFLSKIAALVDRRVMLQAPFKIVDFPAFSAGPAGIKTGRFFVDGPLNLQGQSLVVDLVGENLEMRGKMLAVGFEVVGPLSDPQFYLSEKNVIIKGLTTQDDFDW